MVMNEAKRSAGISAPSRFHSVLFRLILTFTMVLTPIFVMGLAIYQVGVDRMDRQITLSLDQQVDFKVQELENQMRLAQEQMSQLVEEKDILQLSGMYEMMSDYEQIYQLNRLQERIATIRNANSFVKQIDIHLMIQKAVNLQHISFFNDTVFYYSFFQKIHNDFSYSYHIFFSTSKLAHSVIDYNVSFKTS